MSCENKNTVNSELDPIGLVKDSIIMIDAKTISIFDIQFSSVETGPITQSVRAIGNIDVPPSGKADVSGLIGGRITQINVIEGEQVNRGEVLAILESIELLKIQENYLTLFHEIPVLEENYNRQKQLYEEKISSEKKFLEARSILNLKNAQLNSLREELSLLNVNIQKLNEGNLIKQLSIKSPVSGSVEDITAVVGHFVEPNELLFSVINAEHLHLELSVFSNDIKGLKINQQIDYRVPSLSEKVYTGDVFLITNSLDDSDKSLNVHGHIKEEDESIFIPGMMVEAEIVISSVPGNKIFEEGVSTSNDQYFVFEKIRIDENNGVYYLRPIPIEYYGTDDHQMAQFISSNEISNELVSKGAFHLMAILENM